MRKRKNTGKLIGLAIMVMILLTGCTTGESRNYAGIIADGCEFNSTDISELSINNYDRFIHRRFILVRDDYGEMQYVKVNNNVGRHNYDWNNLIEGTNYRYYGENGVSTSLVGVDVSKHQGNINWTQVANSGIDYAMIRIGYRGYGNGAIVKDEFYDSNISGATSNGMPVGLYFYSQAINYNEGVEEANFVLNNIGGYNISYPIAFDTEKTNQEDARTNGVAVEDRTAAAVGFCETIKAAGYTPVVYANRNWFALELDMEGIKDYDIWYAQYADYPDFPYDFKMWQYTEGGSVAGISTVVDLNIGFYNYSKN